jgi:Protein of unknown function (DUF2934)
MITSIKNNKAFILSRRDRQGELLAKNRIPCYIYLCAGNNNLLKEDSMGASRSNLTSVGPRKHFQPSSVSEEQRQSMIAEAAYYRAERRGFQGGDSVADWLAAEREIAERLAK